MTIAINAPLKYLCSANETSQNDLCPAGTESWYPGWRNITHICSLLFAELVTLLRAIYDLSKDNLLQQCVKSEYEWELERYNLALGTEASALRFYDLGNSLFSCLHVRRRMFPALLQIMCILGIVIGPQCHQHVMSRDRQRKQRANRKSGQGLSSCPRKKRLKTSFSRLRKACYTGLELPIKVNLTRVLELLEQIIFKTVNVIFSKRHSSHWYLRFKTNYWTDRI